MALCKQGHINSRLTRRTRNQEPTVIFGENCKHRPFSDSQKTRMNKAWNWGAQKNVAHNAQHLVGKGPSSGRRTTWNNPVGIGFAADVSVRMLEW